MPNIIYTHAFCHKRVEILLKGPANCHRACINKPTPMLYEFSICIVLLSNHVKSAPYLSYSFLPFFSKIDQKSLHHSFSFQFRLQQPKFDKFSYQTSSNGIEKEKLYGIFL